MGLKEKQALASLDFGWSEKRMKEATGKDIKVEVDAETFSSDIDAILYAESRGAEKIANTISAICGNEIGKEAFNDKKVDKVVLKNQAAGNRSLVFDGNKLIVAFSFNSDEYFSEGEAKEIMENLL